MKTIHFRIDYCTHWGESLEVVYSIDGATCQTARLHTTNGTQWEVTLHAPDDARHLRHAYQVCNEAGKAVRIEANSWRMFYFNHRTEVVFADVWANECLPPLYQRSAFNQCVMLPRGGDQLHLEHLTEPYLLLLHALPPADGKRWAVVGNTPEWGAWQIKKARILQRSGTYEWNLPLQKSDFEAGVHYKYVLIDPLDPDFAIWEEGNDRELLPTAIPSTASAIRQDEAPAISLPQWKGVGCVIPVFSLRSEGSFGIGDFGDLRFFVRWAADTGLQAVQLLPINDTTRSFTWRDSYPYNGISVFALHPIYLDPREWKHSRAFAHHQSAAQTLNLLDEVDYEEVLKLKMYFARDLFQELGGTVLRSADYKNFVSDHEEWLLPYARFCANRDRYRTANFRHWPVEAQHGKNEDEALIESQTFYKFLQFLLDRQMRAVHEEARQLGIILKGDIPIGICPDSVPAWIDNRLFHFDGQAGAPPDAFAVHGQNWGFPTYNWDEMAKDGYRWWQRRLLHMERYFDAYRIDHVLGFFRIWEIPSYQVDGLLGRFRPALPYTLDEIRQFGFTKDVQRYVVPSLSAEAFHEWQAEIGGTLLAQVMEQASDGRYEFREGFRTQRELQARIADPAICRKLMDIATEVLFLADADEAGRYHPRVGAQTTRCFHELSPANQAAFNHLHDHFFYTRHNQFWADEAMKKIPAVTHSADTLHPTLRLYPLQGSGMLACAEDLGMVPASVKGVLERLQILSLEIQRMPKEYGYRFADLSHNPYLSVATIATHDMPPLRLWWQENREQTQAFWREALGHKGEAPQEATPEVCEEIVRRHIESPSMLCLLALQDLLAISPTLRSKHPEREQINVPANPDQYWRYRMHLTLEQLVLSTAFNEKLRNLIVQ